MKPVIGIEIEELPTGSMRSKLIKLKPGVDRTTHLFLAGAIWPLIGLMLCYRGLSRLIGSGYEWLILISLLLGICKSVFILDKTARKGIDRILKFGDNTCIGAVYSIKTWLMVLFMISAGIILRKTPIPPHYLGFLYVAIGGGLLFSSRHAWRTWFRLIGKESIDNSLEEDKGNG